MCGGADGFESRLIPAITRLYVSPMRAACTNRIGLQSRASDPGSQPVLSRDPRSPADVDVIVAQIIAGSVIDRPIGPATVVATPPRGGDNSRTPPAVYENAITEEAVMEHKSPAPEERMKARMEADEAGSKAWMESTKPRVKAAKASMETSAVEGPERKRWARRAQRHHRRDERGHDRF
jgi:hypothetical protein